MIFRRPPLIASIAALIAFAILCGLGTWQLQRRVWKQHILDRVAALQHMPARPLAEILARARAGEDVEFARAEADCAPQGLAPSTFLYDLKGGRIGWRVLAACPLADGSMVVIDRGFADVERADLHPPQATYGRPGHVVGVVRRPGVLTTVQKVADAAESEGAGFQERTHAVAWLARAAGRPAAPLVLVAESEAPPPRGVTPSPLPPNIPNRHLEYAITWYGLALALVGVCAGLLWRRERTPS